MVRVPVGPSCSCGSYECDEGAAEGTQSNMSGGTRTKKTAK
jgi:hypothetical protein